MSNEAAPAPAAAGARDEGRALRSTIPRSAHAELDLPERDPVAILEDQHRSRMQGLIPVRIGRMLQSPFAYFRGSAAVMAHDLASGVTTGYQAVICGDAHIANFGLFASPERRLLFDLNDFDEASVGPWEWDVKRLAVSAHIGALDNGWSAEAASEAAANAVRAYRHTLTTLCERSAVDRFYFQVETDWLERVVSSDAHKLVRRTVRKAERRTSEHVLEKITTTDSDGVTRIEDQPPLMMHVETVTEDEVRGLFDQYRTTVRSDVGLLLSQFDVVDFVLRVVGVGSVGTRCYVLLLRGPDGEFLFLQAKEAPPSVTRTYGGTGTDLPACIPEVDAGRDGYRVVTCQRILQAQSDPFLGWVAGFAGAPSVRRPADYYVRQFRDMKGSVELSALSPEQFRTYCGLCGGLLARAHSQSPGAARIDGYLGSSNSFDRAITRWAAAYADQVQRDFHAVERAVHDGRLPVQRDV